MDKYQKSLIELARCSKKVAELKQEIWQELVKSYNDAEAKLPTDEEGMIIYPDEWDALWCSKNRWLSNAFSADIGEDFEPAYLTEKEIREYLRANCMHAYRAYDLILARKQAKKELGIAKRRVTFLANQLLKNNTL